MKFSLATKLYCALVPLVITGVASIGFTRAGLHTNAQELIAARQLKERALEALALLLTQDDASKSLLIDMENADAGERKIRAYDAMQAVFAELRAATAAPELRALVTELDRLDQRELRPLDTQILEAMAAGKAAEARRLYFESYAAARARFEAGVRRLVATAETRAQAAGRRLEERNRRSFLLVALTLGGGLALAIALLVAVTRHATRRLRAAARRLEQQAEFTGDSTARLEAASQTVADGANQQAAAIEESSASLHEIAGMTQSNAANAQCAKERASQTRAAADASAADIGALVQAMHELRAGSTGVAQIIKTIDEIAFQTNILALNAAVEAARAGATGLGFSVVAGEVRSLAQRSKEAARETASRIEASLSQGERSVALSERVAASLQAMIAHAREVDTLVAQIATASHEQSQGLAQITTAATSMDRITQANAASAADSAESARQLARQALALQGTVTELRELVDGRSEPARCDPTAPPGRLHGESPALPEPVLSAGGVA